MDEGEGIVGSVIYKEYKGSILFCFDNGKVAKIPLSSYETKQNRKKLINAYSDKGKLVSIIYCETNSDIIMVSNVNRALVFNSSQLAEKTTKNSQGVRVQTLKKNQYIKSAGFARNAQLDNPSKFKAKNLPARGSFLKENDIAQQLSFE